MCLALGTGCKTGTALATDATGKTSPAPICRLLNKWVCVLTIQTTFKDEWSCVVIPHPTQTNSFSFLLRMFSKANNERKTNEFDAYQI